MATHLPGAAALRLGCFGLHGYRTSRRVAPLPWAGAVELESDITPGGCHGTVPAKPVGGQEARAETRRSGRSIRTLSTVVVAVIGIYHDPCSACKFVVARPSQQPELWMSYLDGARETYRKYDVESVLQYDRICDGGSTAIFFTALETDGHVAGGMRVEGRYESADQAYAVQEWAGRETALQVHREISERIPAGVIEMKAGWVRADAWRRRELTAGLARMCIHSMNLMGVRYALGTVATHAVKRWQTTGGVVSANVAPIAYPDDRYRTVLMWWDRKTFADLAAFEQLPAIMDESAQLTAGARCDGSIPSRVDL